MKRLRTGSYFCGALILAACDGSWTDGPGPSGPARKQGAHRAMPAEDAVPLSEWEARMDAAAAVCSDDSSRQEARFRALQRQLSLISADQFAAAAEFVGQHYKTTLQAALLESMTESLASRSTDTRSLLAVIQTWPPGSGRWMSVRKLAAGLPSGALDELMRSIASSGLPEEHAAATDGLRNRLSNAGAGEYAALVAKSDPWPEHTRTFLRDLEPKYLATGDATLSQGVEAYSHDPGRMQEFLGYYTLRHRGAVAKWIFQEAPEALRTATNLMIAVNDGMDDPEATGNALAAMQVAEESARETAAATLLHRWLDHDPDAASKWLRQTASRSVRAGGGAAILEYLRRTGDTKSLSEWERWLAQAQSEPVRTGQ